MKTTSAQGGKVGFDTVLALGALLPGVKASASKQGVALKLKGQLAACTAINPSAEPNSLMVCLDFPERDTLLEAHPGTYYLTPHYQGYATILVRLAKIGRSELRSRLEQAAQFVGTRTTKKTAKKAARKTSSKTTRKVAGKAARTTAKKAPRRARSH